MKLPSLRLLMRLALAIALVSLFSVSATAQNDEKSEQPQSDDQQRQSNDNSDNSQSDSQQSQKEQQSQPQKKSASDKSSQQANSQNDNDNDEDEDQAPRRDDADRSKNQRQSDADTNVQHRDDRTDRQSTGRTENRDARGRDLRRDFKFGESASRGLTIRSVSRDSISYRSGLRDGDIIMSYGGRPIRSQDDFSRFVVYKPGQRVPVVVLRDGREETIYIVYRDDEGDRDTASNRRALFGAEFDPESTDGAVVTRVQKGSPAHKAGLMVKDIVVALNDDRVSSGREATRIVSSLRAGQRVQIEFTRHGRIEAVLGEDNRDNDNNVDRAVYRSNDETRRVESDSERTDRNSQDLNRSDSRRDDRRAVPRLRN